MNSLKAILVSRFLDGRVQMHLCSVGYDGLDGLGLRYVRGQQLRSKHP